MDLDIGDFEKVMTAWSTAIRRLRDGCLGSAHLSLRSLCIWYGKPAPASRWGGKPARGGVKPYDRKRNRAILSNSDLDGRRVDYTQTRTREAKDPELAKPLRFKYVMYLVSMQPHSFLEE